MSPQIIAVEGLSDLNDALAELPKAVARDVLVAVLTEQGQAIRDAGAALAPVLSGLLRDSYTISTKLSRRQSSLNHKESEVEVYIGPGPEVESIQTEFGNAHQAPEPHLRPAFDANVMKVLDGIKTALAAKIEQSRARLVRKQNSLINRILAGPDATGIRD